MARALCCTRTGPQPSALHARSQVQTLLLEALSLLDPQQQRQHTHFEGKVKDEGDGVLGRGRLLDGGDRLLRHLYVLCVSQVPLCRVGRPIERPVSLQKLGKARFALLSDRSVLYVVGSLRVFGSSAIRLNATIEGVWQLSSRLRVSFESAFEDSGKLEKNTHKTKRARRSLEERAFSRHTHSHRLVLHPSSITLSSELLLSHTHSTMGARVSSRKGCVCFADSSLSLQEKPPEPALTCLDCWDRASAP